MRMKKIFLCAVIIACVFVSAANAFDFKSILNDLKDLATKSEVTSEITSAKPENSLITRPEDSVYFVLKLDDTSKFLRWLLSKENINIFMPLIIGSESSNEILGFVEILSAVIENTPIKSTALIAGINKNDVKDKHVYLQAAFSVDPSINYVVKKISDGTAEARDIARLVLGDKNPIAALAETVIKVERENKNTFRVNNVLFLTAYDGLILMSFDRPDLNAAINALGDEKARLLTSIKRNFDAKDFSLLHVDYDTAAELEPDGELDDINAREYFDKPLNIEFAYKRVPDKFTISTALNLRDALKKKYAEKVLKEESALKKVKGGNIDIKNSGGKTSPLAAIGTQIDFSALKEHPELKIIWDTIAKQLRLRFKISEKEFADLANGAFSLVVNDSVTVEGFKVPALYISQTGQEGAAKKFFDRLDKSPHFSKVHEGVLQMDSSLSPVSFLAALKGETLCLDFAELSSLTEKPEPVPALNELMNTESLSAFWLDFEAVQSWLTNDENGVFAAITPFAMLAGYGKILASVREVIEAKLSVPSVALWSETTEIFHVDFAIRDINVKDGILTKLVKLYGEIQKEQKKSQSK